MIMIQGYGDYTGILYYYYTVTPRNLVHASVEPIPPQNLLPEGCEPVPVLTDDVTGETAVLVQGTDYTVVYENNNTVGTASVILTGCGNYTGTVEIPFEIVEAVLFEGETSVYIPAGESATFRLPQEDGRRYIYAEEENLTFTITTEGSEATVQYYGSSATYYGDNSAVQSVTVTNESDKAVTKLYTGEVPQIQSAALNRKDLPNQIADGWADKVMPLAGLDIVYAAADGTEISRTNHKCSDEMDAYGYIWNIVPVQNGDTPNTYAVTCSWNGEEPTEVNQFTLYTTAAEDLDVIRPLYNGTENWPGT